MDKVEEYQLLKETQNNNIHISFSEFTKFQQCGHKHLLEKYLGLIIEPPTIHLIFGNSIHKAIEIGIKNKSDIEERVLIFREDFSKEMMDKMHDTPDFNNLSQFLTEGEHIIRYLSTEKILKKYEVIGVEYTLYEQLYQNFYFKGFIDLIVQDKETGRYLIIDWKTSGEEWDVSKKKKDPVFMSQMRFYKYFFSRKANIPMEEIDCKYVVLNRRVNKKYPEFGLGKLQPVEIYSNTSDIENSLKMLADALHAIHIENKFLKAKLNGRKGDCFFCSHKNNFSLCSNDENQYKTLLQENRK